jgi:DNA-binding NarL/FixJ family response regulator
MANRVATVLVARNSLFREGLLLILSTTAFRVCKVAATIDDLSLQPTRTSRPFLYLIGTGGDHAVTAPTVEHLRKQNPSARIVVLSDRCELNNALAVLRAGADGYVFEQISRDALIKSLDLVMLGVTILPAPLMRLIGEEHEMVSEDDSAVPATQTDLPTFDHMPRTLS